MIKRRAYHPRSPFGADNRYKYMKRQIVFVFVGAPVALHIPRCSLAVRMKIQHYPYRGNMTGNAELEYTRHPHKLNHIAVGVSFHKVLICRRKIIDTENTKAGMCVRIQIVHSNIFFIIGNVECKGGDGDMFGFITHVTVNVWRDKLCREKKSERNNKLHLHL